MRARAASASGCAARRRRSSARRRRRRSSAPRQRRLGGRAAAGAVVGLAAGRGGRLRGGGRRRGRRGRWRGGRAARGKHQCPRGQQVGGTPHDIPPSEGCRDAAAAGFRRCLPTTCLPIATEPLLAVPTIVRTARWFVNETRRLAQRLQKADDARGFGIGQAELGHLRARFDRGRIEDPLLQVVRTVVRQRSAGDGRASGDTRPGSARRCRWRQPRPGWCGTRRSPSARPASDPAGPRRVRLRRLGLGWRRASLGFGAAGWLRGRRGCRSRRRPERSARRPAPPDTPRPSAERRPEHCREEGTALTLVHTL